MGKDWPRLIGLRFALLLLVLGFFAFAASASGDSGVVFTYGGADYSISYIFKPDTGTFNDLQVLYNGSFEFLPSNFGGITEFELDGERHHPWDGVHTSTLLGEELVNGVYSATFRWSYHGDSLDFTINMQLQDQTLVVDFASDSSKITAFGFDRSENTPNPKVVELPYGHNVLYTNDIFVSAIIDPTVSNASTIEPQLSYFSDTSARYGNKATYQALTNGSRNALYEKVAITASPHIEETFFQVHGNVSPYRAFLVDYVILDLWLGSFDDYQSQIQTLADEGLSDIIVIIHIWQNMGYDNGFPTTFPAGNKFGGPAALQKVIDACEANGYLCAFHTNYVDFYPNSPVWDVDDVALNSDGELIKAWYNKSTEIQSYLMKPSQTIHYAEMYEPDIHATYKSSAAFLDVHSAALPSWKVDYDASLPDAGRQAATLAYYAYLIMYVRSVHNGPVLGEGFGFSTNLWAGRIDAIEADPRSLFDVRNNRSGSSVPTIVDYKLRVLHDLFVPHGAGYLQRFYLDKWSGYSDEELERYLATTLTFGNAGFLHNPISKGIDVEDIKRDYCFTKHIQKFYLSETAENIVYEVNGRFMTLSDALREILPSTSTEDIDSRLSEALGIVQIRYSDDFTVYVNRSTQRDLPLMVDGVDYELLPNDFLAYKEDEFLAYSALVNGVKSDYICPGDAVCGTCPGFQIHLPLLMS